MGPSGYKHSQRQTVRRPRLVILLVLTSVDWGGGLSRIGSVLCDSTATPPRAAGQTESGDLASGFLDACPHGARLTGPQVGRQKEDVKSACSDGGGLDSPFIDLPF